MMMSSICVITSIMAFPSLSRNLIDENRQKREQLADRNKHGSKHEHDQSS